jgi:hypothetical protein
MTDEIDGGYDCWPHKCDKCERRFRNLGSALRCCPGPDARREYTGTVRDPRDPPESPGGSDE